MYGGWKAKTGRTLVSSTSYKDAERRVDMLEGRGFQRVNNMEIIEDIGYDGDTTYVCVMEIKKKKPLD